MSRLCKLVLFLVLTLFATLGQANAKPGWTTSGDAEIDKWFHDQLVPGTGVGRQRCCDISDGAFVEEDVRNGHYWIRWEATKGVWMEVPPTAVIDNQPNKWGQPAVWWGFDEEGDVIYIKCYAPGAKS